MIREIILILLIVAVWHFLSKCSRSKQQAFNLLVDKLAEQRLTTDIASIKLEKLGLERNINSVFSIVRVYSFTCKASFSEHITGQLVVDMKGAKSAILHYASGHKIIKFNAS